MRRVGVGVWEGGVRLYDYDYRKEAGRKERHSLINNLEVLNKSDALLHRLGGMLSNATSKIPIKNLVSYLCPRSACIE
jgi:hypothetical protein